MIDRRELKRIGNKVGKYLDPLALFLLIAVFIIPAMAVVNLSPKSKPESNVLGARSDQGITIVMVGGIHDFLKDERIEVPTDGMYVYKAEMIKHGVGKYSKPILQIVNSTNNELKIMVEGGTLNPIDSPLYLMYNDNKYSLEEENGNKNSLAINVPKQSKKILFLTFDTQTPLLFNEEVEITISQ